jgi:hypothetical protein
VYERRRFLHDVTANLYCDNPEHPWSLRALRAPYMMSAGVTNTSSSSLASTPGCYPDGLEELAVARTQP